MYITPKKIVAVSVAAGMILAACISNDTYASQTYDQNDAGIYDKVTAYLERNEGVDPVADLTNGAVTYESLANPGTVSSALADIAISSEKSGLQADIKGYKYTQFAGRAIATTSGQLNIRKEPSEDSELIGALERAGLCQVIERGAEWTKISSGNCVGYVKTEYLAFGDAAGEWAASHDVGRIATVDTTTLLVREKPDADSDCLAMVPEGDEFTILDEVEGWYLIRVNSDIKGYIKSDYASVSFKTEPAKTVAEQEEEERWERELAKLRAEESSSSESVYTYDGSITDDVVYDDDDDDDSYSSSSDNDSSSDDDSSYSDDSSSDDSSSSESSSNDSSYDDDDGDDSDDSYEAPSYSTDNGVSDLQQAVVDFAVQYVGYPYVYGGTSLTNGTDCSGFTMLVYEHFGVSLPHGATSQSYYGTPVSLSDIEPGDLLFYPDDEGYGHVTIYMGGGQVVHASNSRDGIKISDYGYRTPTFAVRFFGLD